MKIAENDYSAKLRYWALHPRVHPLPAGPRVPRFTIQRFNSHEEMNAWKRELYAEIARSALHGHHSQKT